MAVVEKESCDTSISKGFGAGVGFERIRRITT